MNGFKFQVGTTKMEKVAVSVSILEMVSLQDNCGIITSNLI